MNLSLLVHTFNGYQHFWEGQAVSFEHHWPHPEIEIHFGTDFVQEQHPWHVGEMIYSGSGEWSDRLRVLLKQIPTDYVLYFQEDHWLTKKPPDLAFLMSEMVENDLLRLQISPIVHFYKLTGSGKILFFDPQSKYLVSHQPSIWKKKFLLDCLTEGETPWVNEYRGTLRLQHTPETREWITNRIAIYPYDWYKHVGVKGKLVSG